MLDARLPGWLLGAALVGALSLHAPIALAQSAPMSAQAQTAYDRGRAALRTRRYNDAVGALQEAARLDARPDTWRWLGVALQGVGRDAEAIAAYTRYLDAPGSDAVPEQIVQLRANVQFLRASLASATRREPPAQTPARQGWVLPTVITGGVVVAVGLTALVIWAASSTEAPLDARYGNFMEAPRKP